jgi:hypothetical protein
MSYAFHVVVHQLAQNVPDHDVNLLDPRGGVMCDMNLSLTLSSTTLRMTSIIGVQAQSALLECQAIKTRRHRNHRGQRFYRSRSWDQPA